MNAAGVRRFVLVPRSSGGIHRASSRVDRCDPGFDHTIYNIITISSSSSSCNGNSRSNNSNSNNMIVVIVVVVVPYEEKKKRKDT